MFTGMLEWDVSNGGNFEMGGIPIGEIFKFRIGIYPRASDLGNFRTLKLSTLEIIIDEYWNFWESKILGNLKFLSA